MSFYYQLYSQGDYSLVVQTSLVHAITLMTNLVQVLPKTDTIHIVLFWELTCTKTVQRKCKIKIMKSSKMFELFQAKTTMQKYSKTLEENTGKGFLSCYHLDCDLNLKNTLSAHICDWIGMSRLSTIEV